MMNNVATGSERAGFSGLGIPCKINVMQGNEAHSCLFGFLFDFYALETHKQDCVKLSGFSAWKIYLYGIYGEIMSTTRVDIIGVSISDCKAGIQVFMNGADSSAHVLQDKFVNISNGLIVGISKNNLNPDKRPTLHTCIFPMTWCDHLKQKARDYLIAPSDLSFPFLTPSIRPFPPLFE